MKLIIIILLFSSFPAYAAIIDCYSSTKHIYHGYVNDIAYNDIFLIFTEKKSQKIFATNSECIIKLEKDDSYAA